MKLIFTIVLMACFGTAAAQPPFGGLWLALQTPVQLGSRWQWHNDAGYRTLSNQPAAHQYLYRTGIRYTVSKKISAAAGGAIFYTRTSYSKLNTEFGREQRLWQELTWQQQLHEKITLDSRLRTEQRFFYATTREAAFTAFRHRLQAGITRQLNTKWSIQLVDEYMAQARSGHVLRFNQNRLGLNLLHNTSSSTQLQAGYMCLLWPGSSQHIIRFTIQKKISFHANSSSNEK